MADSPLIAQLDPDRGYGERTYTDIVAAVESGELTLSPGQTLPVIKDTRTNQVVAGTGRPPGKGAHAAFSRAYIQEQFADSAPDIWKAIMAGIMEGDPRWAKLALEYGIGAPLQDKGNEATATEFMKVLAALAETKHAPLDDFIEAEFTEP